MNDLQNETYMVETPTCRICNEGGVVEVPAVGFLQWNFGMLIQDAFPELDAAIREQLKTGYHSACFDKMLGE